MSVAATITPRNPGRHTGPLGMRLQDPDSKTSVQLLAALTGVLVLLSLRTWAFTTDDAYITLRYARNFLNGHGLVFNPGGARIEGFSNPLLLFVSLLPLGAGVDPIPVIKVLSAVSLPGALVSTWVLARRLGGGVWPSLAAVAVVGSFPGVVYWAYSGLETMLYLALVSGGAALLAGGTAGTTRRQAVWGGVLLGLAAWTRVEGGLFAFVAAAGCAVYWVRHRHTTAHFWCLIPITVAGIALLGFRLAYYGHVLPNTYYCKSSGEPWLLVRQFAAAAWPLILVALMRPVSRWRGAAPAIAAACVVHIFLYRNAAPVVAQECRHFLVLLPLLAALGAANIQALPRAGRNLVTAAAGICVMVVVTVGLYLGAWYVEDYARRAEARLAIARYLNRHAQPQDQVMLGDIGIISYHISLPVIDYFCLADEYFAPCFRGEPERFVQHAMAERRPRWIVTHSVGADRRYTRRDIAAIAQSPEYRHYRCRFSIHAGRYGYYHLYERETGAMPYEPLEADSIHRACPRR